MAVVFIVFLLSAALRAWAQSPEKAPEKAYVAARVQMGAVLEEKSKSADAFDTTKPGGGAWDAAHDQAKSNLVAQLPRVIGTAPSPEACSVTSTFIPKALCSWLADGLLDDILSHRATGTSPDTT